jgi:hypothetical protein
MTSTVLELNMEENLHTPLFTHLGDSSAAAEPNTAFDRSCDSIGNDGSIRRGEVWNPPPPQESTDATNGTAELVL